MATGLPTRHHLYLFGIAVLIEAANRIGSAHLIDRLARGLGALAYRGSHAKRRRMEHHLARAFGTLPDVERDRIVRGAFDTFWDETLSFVPWRSAAPPEPEVTGLEHLEVALAAGRGAILWESGYFGLRNIAKQALQRRGIAVHQVHADTHRAGFARDLDPSWLRDRIVFPYFTAREREFTSAVLLMPDPTPLAVLRKFHTMLAQNQVLCITADVAHGARLVTLPVIGAPQQFATGMVSLARSCGAALLPLFCVRAADGRVRVIVEPAVPTAANGDRETETEAPLRHYAALLETYIRRYPEQYRNWHFPWWAPT